MNRQDNPPDSSSILAASLATIQSPFSITGIPTSFPISTISRSRSMSAGSDDRMDWVRQCTVRAETPVERSRPTRTRVASCVGRSRILTSMGTGRHLTRFLRICRDSSSQIRRCDDGPKRATETHIAQFIWSREECSSHPA